jgi:hypothetical protein
MTPIEKFGDEFSFDRLVVPFADGRRLVRHQAACACVTAKQTKEDTLNSAWQVVRELALWLTESLKSLPDEESFQIIVAWSSRERPQYGHIFKVCGFKDLLQQILRCESYQQYAQATGDNWVPMPGWEKDVFSREHA